MGRTLPFQHLLDVGRVTLCHFNVIVRCQFHTISKLTVSERLLQQAHTHTITHTHTHTHAYTHASVRAHIQKNIHPNASIHVHTRAYTHAHTHTWIYTNTSLYIPTHVCLHKFFNLHSHTHTHTHTRTHTHTYTHTHTSMYILTHVCVYTLLNVLCLYALLNLRSHSILLFAAVPQLSWLCQILICPKCSTLYTQNHMHALMFAFPLHSQLYLQLCPHSSDCARSRSVTLKRVHIISWSLPKLSTLYTQEHVLIHTRAWLKVWYFINILLRNLVCNCAPTRGVVPDLNPSQT